MTRISIVCLLIVSCRTVAPPDEGVRSVDSALGSISNRSSWFVYTNGQRRLHTGLYHARGEGGQTSLDSTGGRIGTLYEQNLREFLADIRAAGFEEILFGFFPMWTNNPQDAAGLPDDIFQENWNVIVNTRPILVRSGLRYMIYGNGNDIYPAVRTVYEYSAQKMASLGLNQDWIIGETYYNGSDVARAFSDAVASTGKQTTLPRAVAALVVGGQERGRAIGSPSVPFSRSASSLDSGVCPTDA